jgi:hypothetical protein
VREQLKREIDMLKDEKNELKGRNKKLIEKLDEVSWQVKELSLAKED